jgi:hypothetical protein
MAGHTWSLSSVLMARMSTGGVADVFRGPEYMTGFAVSVDIERSSRPIRRDLSTVTTGTGTGTAIRTGCAALRIKIRWYSDFGSAVMV